MPSSLLKTDDYLTRHHVSGLLFLFLWYKRVEHQAKAAMHLLLKHFLPTRHCARYCNLTIKLVGVSSTVNHRGFNIKLFHVVTLFSPVSIPRNVTSEIPRAIVLLPGCCIWRGMRNQLKELASSPAFFRGESRIHSYHSLEVY